MLDKLVAKPERHHGVSRESRQSGIAHLILGWQSQDRRMRCQFVAMQPVMDKQRADVRHVERIANDAALVVHQGFRFPE